MGQLSLYTQRFLRSKNVTNERWPRRSNSESIWEWSNAMIFNNINARTLNSESECKNATSKVGDGDYF